jgi:AAA domain, putative AbiEii toxin, Type IV TA system
LRWRPTTQRPLPPLWAQVRANVFILDEPERHLHPRAQRALARWLANLIRVYGSQALVCTHSVAFMNQADALLHVRRQPSGRSTVRPAAADELSALSAMAAELGLDRGELLAGVAVFFFVEGVSDELVLTTSFGETLRQLGVAVIPIGGATRAPQIIDAQIATRYSSAWLAMLVDDLSADFVARVQRDAKYRTRKRASKKTEEQAVARLIDHANEAGRHVQVIRLAKRDIFFALDSRSIREEFAAMHPNRPHYPGHSAFLAELAAEPKDTLSGRVLILAASAGATCSGL